MEGCLKFLHRDRGASHTKHVCLELPSYEIEFDLGMYVHASLHDGSTQLGSHRFEIHGNLKIRGRNMLGRTQDSLVQEQNRSLDLHVLHLHLQHIGFGDRGDPAVWDVDGLERVLTKQARTQQLGYFIQDILLEADTDGGDALGHRCTRTGLNFLRCKCPAITGTTAFWKLGHLTENQASTRDPIWCLALTIRRTKEERTD
ncbi:hypothetical protein BC830DRAFT_1119514 [Chytriomyces sp. MP71]|nr:hypothetical protein BC830DRAFT_1119514 [Chytriomyces sp. MP71]